MTKQTSPASLIVKAIAASITSDVRLFTSIVDAMQMPDYSAESAVESVNEFIDECIAHGRVSIGSRASLRSQWKRILMADVNVIIELIATTGVNGRAELYKALAVPKAKTEKGADTAPKAAKPQADESGDPSPTGAPDTQGEILSQITALRSRLLLAKADLKALDALDEVVAFVRLSVK
jgi:hypothetical protein